MSLFHELQRRKVVRTTIGYLVAAFVAAQVIQLLVEALQLSPRILKAFVVLEIVAIPLVIGFAWAFDITRHGVQATDPPQGSRALAWRRLGVPVAVALALLFAGAFFVFNEPAVSDDVRAVAVLPFENRSGVAADDYFSDGMTDELAAALARVPGLRLAGRTSSYVFKGKALPAQEIGRALAVSALVSGTVRRSGERLRVSAQLVNAADGKVMWDSVFESRSGDVFSLQDEFTRAIVAALLPAIGRGKGAAPPPNENRGTADLEAYDLYMKGRYYWLDRASGTIAKPIPYFEQAVERDPKFARAYAALAMAYATLTTFVPESRDTAAPLVEFNARKALALDPKLADAHLAMGVAMDLQVKISEALAHHRAAVALEPENPTAHHWLGGLLNSAGHTEEALTELRRATRIDPLAKSAGANLALGLIYARRFPEAISEARRVLAIDSTFMLGLHVLGLAQALGGQPDSAVQTLEHVSKLYPDVAPRPALLLAYGIAGRWEQVQRMRAELHAGKGTRAGVGAAFADLLMGDPEPLLGLLQTRDGQLTWWWSAGGFGCNPLLDPLWSDPRFRTAMRAVGSEVCSYAKPWPLRRDWLDASP